MRPSAFLPSNTPVEVAWVKDPAAPIYLGNEFLLWLWFVLDAEGDTITLADESDVAVMLARTLVLDCPRAVSGNETIRSDAPTQLPEARRAVQAGKLPRQAGLILVRHDQQYELTLQAETLAVSGAKLPEAEEREERARLEERVSQVRHLIETVDLLYDAFLERRLATGLVGGVGPDAALAAARRAGPDGCSRLSVFSGTASGRFFRWAVATSSRPCRVRPAIPPPGQSINTFRVNVPGLADDSMMKQHCQLRSICILIPGERQRLYGALRHGTPRGRSVRPKEAF